MINPRTSTEFWDGTEEPLHYPNATRRRAVLAHVLGVVGVLGTIALAAAAFVPRASSVVAKANAWSSPSSAGTETKRTGQLPLAEGRAPHDSDEPVASAPLIAIPQEPATLVPAATAQPVEPLAATPSAPPTAPALVAATLAAPAASATPASPTGALASTPLKPSHAALRRTRAEPRLTWREIERRKQRYAEWLQQQGLEPVP